jgi:hypothetical protein
VGRQRSPYMLHALAGKCTPFQRTTQASLVAAQMVWCAEWRSGGGRRPGGVLWHRPAFPPLGGHWGGLGTLVLGSPLLAAPPRRQRRTSGRPGARRPRHQPRADRLGLFWLGRRSSLRFPQLPALLPATLSGTCPKEKNPMESSSSNGAELFTPGQKHHLACGLAMILQTGDRQVSFSRA